MGWKSFDVPASLIGEKRTNASAYVITYQTEVLLPKDGQYAGYCFLHPSKLVSERAGGVASITYNDDFVFELIKKDREQGKRYRRYKLQAPELPALYEDAVRKVLSRREKQEQRRRARVGEVIVVTLHRGKNVSFLFHAGQRYYYASGETFTCHDEICTQRRIAGGIPRGRFEDCWPRLRALADDYAVVRNVRHQLEQPPKRTPSSAKIQDAFRLFV